MDLDYSNELFYAELSDEAAAQIAEFLMQLALHFENTRFSQIRRHYQVSQPEPEYDPRQLELFDPF
jgi:hypothetical protein